MTRERWKLRILLCALAPIELGFCVYEGGRWGFKRAYRNLHDAWHWECPPKRPQTNRLNRRISKWLKEHEG